MLSVYIMSDRFEALDITDFSISKNKIAFHKALGFFLFHSSCEKIVYAVDNSTDVYMSSQALQHRLDRFQISCMKSRYPNRMPNSRDLRAFWCFF